MTPQLPRRRFLQATAIGSIAGGLPWAALPRVSAQDAQSNALAVQFAADIEPLVRLLESTPREDVVGVCVKKIHSGLNYQQLLAALQLAGIRNDQLTPAESTNGSTANTVDSIATIFESIGKDASAACSQTLSYLQIGGDITSFMDAARLLIFQKGTDSHDYKFSSAVLEDFYHVSPAWRHRCLAASVYKLRSSRDPDNKLTQNAAAALRPTT